MEEKGRKKGGFRGKIEFIEKVKSLYTGTHLVCLMNQAICFEVMLFAEMIKSPSFSRFSSSNTITNLPALMSATVPSMESNLGLEAEDDDVDVEGDMVKGWKKGDLERRESEGGGGESEQETSSQLLKKMGMKGRA
jgi:hypothetical protein